MKCPKCNKRIFMSVNVALFLPGEYYGNITKSAISKKTCTIQSVNWDKVKFICPNCLYTDE